MKYGRALRIARAMAGLEQRELAKRAGLDASHISLIERDRRNPSVATLEKIAKALRIPFPLLTLLATESRDLKTVDESEIHRLAEFLARMLLSDAPIAKKRKKPGSGAGSKA